MTELSHITARAEWEAAESYPHICGPVPVSAVAVVAVAVAVADAVAVAVSRDADGRFVLPSNDR
jgi:uncharacterized protein (DUF952 family)